MKTLLICVMLLLGSLLYQVMKAGEPDYGAAFERAFFMGIGILIYKFITGE